MGGKHLHPTPNQESKLALSSALGEEVVEVLVGPKRKKFPIHKKLLCNASDFFSKAFNGGFQEAKDGSMNLPVDDPTAFELFIDWLYRSSLPSLREFEGRKTLYNLYFFAEKLCLNDLANQTMDKIRENHRRWLYTHVEAHFQLLGDVYSNTLADSPLRTFIIMIAVYEFYWVKDTVQLEGENGTKPKGALGSNRLRKLLDICKNDPDLFDDYLTHSQRFNDTNRPRDPSNSASNGFYGDCYFHRHGKGEICYLKASKLVIHDSSTDPSPTVDMLPDVDWLEETEEGMLY